MSLARTIRRGAFLKARFGVNPIQYDSRSFGTAGAASRKLASDIVGLLVAAEPIACGLKANDSLINVSGTGLSRNGACRPAPGAIGGPPCRRTPSRIG